ncbi:MAG: hypothetical protein A4E65_02375 [Syntrophorhabdus sp. PtaU1.Bin153]|nr:MAG: hypothetical protein A4E65_02375 [Syntrophorhabdus sp. PtaU1.Bin153]
MRTCTQQQADSILRSVRVGHLEGTLTSLFLLVTTGFSGASCKRTCFINQSRFQ